MYLSFTHTFMFPVFATSRGAFLRRDLAMMNPLSPLCALSSMKLYLSYLMPVSMPQVFSTGFLLIIWRLPLFICGVCGTYECGICKAAMEHVLEEPWNRVLKFTVHSAYGYRIGTAPRPNSHDYVQSHFNTKDCCHASHVDM